MSSNNHLNFLKNNIKFFLKQIPLAIPKIFPMLKNRNLSFKHKRPWEYYVLSEEEKFEAYLMGKKDL